MISCTFMLLLVATALCGENKRIIETREKSKEVEIIFLLFVLLLCCVRCCSKQKGREIEMILLLFYVDAYWLSFFGSYVLFNIFVGGNLGEWTELTYFRGESF